MPFKSVEKKKAYNRSAKRKLGFHRNKQRVKDRVFAAYGGYVCSCCGETNPQLLTLDHKNNDGAQHRKTLRSSSSLFYWIIRNKFPQTFRVLCWNCNSGRAINAGICPHDTFTRTDQLLVDQSQVFRNQLHI